VCAWAEGVLGENPAPVCHQLNTDVHGIRESRSTAVACTRHEGTACAMACTMVHAVWFVGSVRVQTCMQAADLEFEEPSLGELAAEENHMMIHGIHMPHWIWYRIADCSKDRDAPSNEPGYTNNCGPDKMT
jgi:hypothetical protein